MINCKFIYKFKSGGTSDSLNHVYKVHSVPNIGDTINLVNNSGESVKSKVKNVIHNINTEDDTHEIIVLYSGE